MLEAALIAAISAGIPAIVTLITFFYQNRASKKHSAKQSILQMIMEDYVLYETMKNFPTNYGRIHDEYDIYHKNGGNGEVTKKVSEYDRWFGEVEAKLKERSK